MEEIKFKHWREASKDVWKRGDGRAEVVLDAGKWIILDRSGKPMENRAGNTRRFVKLESAIEAVGQEWPSRN